MTAGERLYELFADKFTPAQIERMAREMMATAKMRQRLEAVR